ncbi:MAG TPA: hypothetical protein VMI52_05980 [Acetobacteraceae bacterium]|nr:hypothetical protein [Acetobacteraceae bacterium]
MRKILLSTLLLSGLFSTGAAGIAAAAPMTPPALARQDGPSKLIHQAQYYQYQYSYAPAQYYEDGDDWREREWRRREYWHRRHEEHERWERWHEHHDW